MPLVTELNPEPQEEVISRFYLGCRGQKIRLIPPLVELASILLEKQSFADAAVARHSVDIAIYFACC